MTCRKFWYYWHTRNDSDSRNGWNASHSGHSGFWDRLLSLHVDRVPASSYSMHDHASILMRSHYSLSTQKFVKLLIFCCFALLLGLMKLSGNLSDVSQVLLAFVTSHVLAHLCLHISFSALKYALHSRFI